MPEEAPEAIFEMGLGDTEVDLFLTGSWQFGLSGSLGFLFHPELGAVSYPFPGMGPGFLFDQVPDITLALWLKERYFFETSFLPNSPFNTILFGYQGKEGEFVQSVRLGNKDIGISSYPYLSFTESREKLPGLSARFQTDWTSHELMLRYEPTTARSQSFIGMNKVRRESLEPASYSKDRFFVLPDTDIDAFSLLLEDGNGSIIAAGSRFRPAVPDEYVYSSEEGTLSLNKSPSGRVLVYYEKTGSPIGSAGLGTDAVSAVSGSAPDFVLDPDNPLNFEWGAAGGAYTDLFAYLGYNDFTDLRVSADGQDYLLLYEPGRFSLFALYNQYLPLETSLSEETRVNFVFRGSSGEKSFSPSIVPVVREEQGRISLAPGGSGSRSLKRRYPFVDDYPELYGPDRIGEKGKTDFLIEAVRLEAVEEIRIDDSPIPGSVRVFQNGSEVFSFSVDYETGTIAFPFPIYPDDRIEVRYYSFAPESTGGDLLFASGNRLFFSENLLLDLALGLRWNIRNDSYSIHADDHQGSIVSSAELSYEDPSVSSSLDIGLAYTNPDTSGYIRLLGMEEKDLEIPISQSNIVPSSVPDASLIAGLSRSNRGKLIYKNFWNAGAFGSPILEHYNYSDPEVYDYISGNPTGPYVASAGKGETVEGRVMVMDYIMDADDWTGAMIKMTAGESLDLSDASSISFYWKALDLSGSVDAYIHFGSLGEDLDADGILDSEESSLSDGYPFNDSGNGVTLYIGGLNQGSGGIDSEDINGNGILDPEYTDLIVEQSSTAADFPHPSSAWQKIEIRRSAPGSAVDFSKLTRVNSIRFVLVENTSAPASGRLIVGPVSIKGTSTRLTASDPGTNVWAREVKESTSPAENRLEAVYPEVEEIFHSGFNEQRVLEINWDSMTSGNWNLVDYTNPVPPRQYERLAFYIRSETLDGGNADLDVRFTDAKGRGIRSAFPISQKQEWQKIEILGGENRILINGSEASGSVSVDADAAKLNRFSISLQNAQSGTLFLDEVHMSYPQGRLGFGSSLVFDYTYPGTIISAGETEILSKFRFSQEASFRTKGFSPGSISIEEAGSFSSRTRAGADILYSRLEAEFGIFGTTENADFIWGHSLSLPAEGFPIQLKDRYRREYKEENPSMSRETALIFSVDTVGTLALSGSAFLIDDELNQQWLATANSSWNSPFGLQTGFRLDQRYGGYHLPDVSYPESWILGFSYFAPWREGSGIARSGTWSTEFGLDPEPIGFRIPVSFSYYNSANIDGRQKNQGSIGLVLPWKIQGEGQSSWLFSFAYDRSFNHYISAERGHSFANDFHLYGRGFQSQSYIYNSIPIADLFIPLSETTFPAASSALSFAAYEPSISFSLKRPFGSRLIDLFIPANFESSLQRSLIREEDSLDAEKTLGLSMTSIALNLFGKFGAYPVFNFYRSDEFTNNIGFNITHNELTGQDRWSLSLKNGFSLYGENDAVFSLSNYFSIEQNGALEDSAEILFLWTSPFYNFLRWDFFEDLIERDTRYKHTERIGIEAEKSADGITDTQFTMTLGHETAVVVPNEAELRVYLDIGWGLSPALIEQRRQDLFLLGFEAGIEFRIQF